MRNLTRFVADETGATAIEYGVIAVLVSISIVASTTHLGTALQNLYNAFAGNASGALR